MRKFRVGTVFGFVCGVAVGACLLDMAEDYVAKRRGVRR